MPSKDKAKAAAARARYYYRRKAKYLEQGLSIRGTLRKYRETTTKLDLDNLDALDIKALQDPLIREGRLWQN